MKTFHPFAIKIPSVDHSHSKAVALVLAIITCTSLSSMRLRAADERNATPNSGSQSVADYSDPIKTYRTYLAAIKRDDQAVAKACCTISDGNKSGVLDVLVGVWVAFHRFNNVVSAKFGQRESAFLRDDCTDAALDRTLSRVAKSTFKTTGETAKLTIRWEKDDSSPNPVFMFGDEAIPFRKVGGFWKLDCNDLTGLEKPSDFLKPGSWGSAFRDGMNLIDEAIAGIDSGRLKTWEQVAEEITTKGEVLSKKWAEDHQDPAPDPAKGHNESRDEKASKKE